MNQTKKKTSTRKDSYQNRYNTHSFLIVLFCECVYYLKNILLFFLKIKGKKHVDTEIN